MIGWSHLFTGTCSLGHHHTDECERKACKRRVKTTKLCNFRLTFTWSCGLDDMVCNHLRNQGGRDGMGLPSRNVPSKSRPSHTFCLYTPVNRKCARGDKRHKRRSSSNRQPRARFLPSAVSPDISNSPSSSSAKGTPDSGAPFPPAELSRNQMETTQPLTRGRRQAKTTYAASLRSWWS